MQLRYGYQRVLDQELGALSVCQSASGTVWGTLSGWNSPTGWLWAWA